MKFDATFLTSLLLTSVAASAVDTTTSNTKRHVARVNPDESETLVSRDFEELWKRKGGGGGGGRGGGGGGGTKGSGTTSGGSRGNSGTSGGRGTNTRSTANNGGYSSTGTGPQPRFGGGKFYGGGAAVPYRSGGRSPGGRSIAPIAFGVGALAFWPGIWLTSAYLYPYNYHHRYYNSSSRRDEDREVICACEENAVCACEEIEDQDYWEDLIEDGDYSKLNKSVVTVSEVNGTQTILINGTLPNGTTVPSDDPEDYAEFIENAAAVLRVVGLWPAAAAVIAAALMA